MVQWVKDPALSLQGLGSLLWCMFDPWPGKFHMPWEYKKKKKKEMKYEYSVFSSHTPKNH